MNYYVRKALRLFQRTTLSSHDFLTNQRLVKAIRSVEMAHRNLVWRVFEYIFLFLTPIDVSISRTLTIGKFQIALNRLSCKRRARMMFEANEARTVDRLLFNNVQVADWSNLQRADLATIASFYNGAKSEEYAEALQILLAE